MSRKLLSVVLAVLLVVGLSASVLADRQSYIMVYSSQSDEIRVRTFVYYNSPIRNDDPTETREVYDFSLTGTHASKFRYEAWIGAEWYHLNQLEVECKYCPDWTTGAQNNSFSYMIGVPPPNYDYSASPKYIAMCPKGKGHGGDHDLVSQHWGDPGVCPRTFHPANDYVYYEDCPGPSPEACCIRHVYIEAGLVLSGWDELTYRKPLYISIWYDPGTVTQTTTHYATLSFKTRWESDQIEVDTITINLQGTTYASGGPFIHYSSLAGDAVVGNEYIAGATMIVEWLDGDGPFDLKWKRYPGDSWHTIATDVSANYYYWNVPRQNNNRYSATLRVVDDNKNWDKGITIRTMMVRYPRAGEEFTSGDTIYLLWDRWGVKDTVKKVQLQYSKNGGTDWINITTLDWYDSDEKDSFWGGFYKWTVPDVNNTKNNCYFRVRCKRGDGTVIITDKSDAAFTIYPSS